MPKPKIDFQKILIPKGTISLDKDCILEIPWRMNSQPLIVARKPDGPIDSEFARIEREIFTTVCCCADLNDPNLTCPYELARAPKPKVLRTPSFHEPTVVEEEPPKVMEPTIPPRKRCLNFDCLDCCPTPEICEQFGCRSCTDLLCDILELFSTGCSKKTGRTVNICVNLDPKLEKILVQVLSNSCTNLKHVDSKPSRNSLFKPFPVRDSASCSNVSDTEDQEIAEVESALREFQKARRKLIAMMQECSSAHSMPILKKSASKKL